MKKLFHNLYRPLLLAFVAAATLTSCGETIVNVIDTRTPLSAPQVVTAQVTATTVSVEWATIRGSEVYGYKIEKAGEENAETEINYTNERMVMFNGLEKDTEYTVSVMAVARITDETNINSEFGTTSVRTLAEETKPFTFETEYIGQMGAVINILPTDASGSTYTVNLFTDDALQVAKGDMHTLMQNWIDAQTASSMGYGLYSGPATFGDVINYYPDTKYHCVAAYVTAGIVGELASVEFTTEAVVPGVITYPDKTFTAEVDELTQTTAAFLLTPSDEYLPFVYAWGAASRFEGMSEAQIVDQIFANDAAHYLVGPHELSFGGLLTDTDYVLFAVGCTMRLQTTPLFRHDFRTKDANFENETFEGLAFTDARILSLSPVESDTFAGRMTGLIAATPNEAAINNDMSSSGAHYGNFRLIIVPADYAAQKSDNELAEIAWNTGRWSKEEFDEEVNYLASFSESYYYNGLEQPIEPSIGFAYMPIAVDHHIYEGEEYVIVTLTWDNQGIFGKLGRFPFTATEGGETPGGDEGDNDDDFNQGR